MKLHPDKILLCLVLAGFGLIGHAQGSNAYVQPMHDLTPKTPEAAALSKFIDIPAGSYTGTTSFSVPIYQIESNGHSYPVSLDYHASGIKVGEVSGRIGLGWSLNVAGVSLSKQTIGIEDPNYIASYDAVNFQPTGTTGQDYLMAIQVTGADGVFDIDTQPDVYSYNINGESGKFIRDSSGAFQMIPYSPVRVTGNGSGMPPGFTFTMTDGVKYKFIYNGSQKTIGANGAQDDRNNFRISEIEFLNGEKIQFNYRFIQYKYLVNNRVSETISVFGDCFNDDGTGNTGNLGNRETELNYAVNGDYIPTEVVFPFGKVVFKYSDEKSPSEKRKDIVDDVYCYSAQVKDLSGNLVRDFAFDQSYFVSSGYVENDYPLGFEMILEPMRKALYYRLKLDAVHELLSGANYGFEYDQIFEMPNRFSYDTDFWGFYNGANNSSDLPKTLYMNRFYGEANKEPNIVYGTACSLNKITLPTGGTQEIEYEADDYYFEGTDEAYEHHEFGINTASNAYNTEYPFVLDGTVDQRIKFEMQDNPLGECIDCLPLDGSDYIYGVLLDHNHAVVANFYLNKENQIALPANQTYYLKLMKHGSGTFTGSLKLSWYKDNSQEVAMNKKAGSLRVRRVVLNPINGTTITRNFEYKNPDTGFSSGVWHGDLLRPYSKSTTVGHKRHCFTNALGELVCDYSCFGTCEKIVLSNSSGINLSGANGKSVGYSYVNEIYTNDTNTADNFNALYSFTNYTDDNIQAYRESPFTPVEDNSFMRGLLVEKKLFDNTGSTKRREVNNYDFDGHFNQFSADNYDASSIAKAVKIDLINMCVIGSLATFYFDWKMYRIPSAWVKQTSQETTDYLPSGEMRTLKEFTYRADYTHTFPKKITTTLNSGAVTETLYTYPQDITTEQGMADLIAENRIDKPVATEVTKNGVTLSKDKTLYKKDTTTGNITSPVAVYAARFPNALPSISPEIGNLEKKITFDSYDSRGNVTQYTQQDGVPVALIWGYGRTRPIAKLENMAYSSLPALTISDLQAKSDADNDNCHSLGSCNEQLLRTALNNLRTAFPAAMITTYTYDPLIGVTSIIDPKGDIINYTYDSSGRLLYVKDKDGNKLNENEYHYNTAP